MKWVVLLCCLALHSRVISQLTWQRTYGGFSTEEGNSVVATIDGRYVVVGSTGSFGEGAGDVYVLMLAPDGQREWSMTLGGAGVDQGRQVIQTSDGGFLIAGYTNSSGAGGYDGYLVKLDGAGSPIWERTYGGEGWDFLFSVAERPDGGYLATGETYSAGQGSSDVWLVSISEDGNEDWERTYGGSGTDFARRIESTTANGFIVAGAITVGGDQNAWLLNVELDGDTIWTSIQGGDSLDHAAAVVETQDGGFAAVGTTKSFNAVTEAYHFKVDVDGNLLWEWNWGQVNDQETNDIKELPDGRFLTTGYVTSGGSGGRDMFIFFTGPDGDFLRGVSNGGDNGQGDEVGLALDLTSDGGSIHCGSTSSFGYGPQDVYVVSANDTGWTSTVQVDTEFDPIGIMDRPLVRPPSIFPNPAALACRLSTQEGLEWVRLNDAQGRLAREWHFPVPRELDLHGLAAGTYQLVTWNEAGARTSQPLIIAAP